MVINYERKITVDYQTLLISLGKDSYRFEFHGEIVDNSKGICSY